MRGLLLGAVMALATTGPALAYCYEDIGCDDSDVFSRADLRPLSCEALWEVRNGIYFQNGYCFKTERALSFFGDDQCTVEDQSRVRLNTIERQNILTITAVEDRKGCN